MKTKYPITTDWIMQFQLILIPKKRAALKVPGRFHYIMCMQGKTPIQFSLKQKTIIMLWALIK